MRVLLVDDHALFREGLRGLLEKRGIEVVAQASGGQEGLKLAIELEPDIILLDLRMGDISGLDTLKRLRAQNIETPAVMLTTSSEEHELVEALRSGASGYLLKDMEPDELIAALREIMSGKTVVAPGLTATLARVIQDGDGSESNKPASPFATLTPRELEILCHLVEGESNKVIARNLSISDGTVKLHVKAILRKLKVQSRVEAAVMAVEHGICDRVAMAAQNASRGQQ